MMDFSKNGKLAILIGHKLGPKSRQWARLARDYYRSKFDPYPYRSYSKVRRPSIFIHIPKAAGTSICRAIGTTAGDHCTYREFLQANPTRFEKSFKFCIVRNPVSRLISAYNYLQSGGNQSTDLKLSGFINSSSHDFRSFVLDFLDKDVIYRINVLRPQYYFIYNEFNHLMVDFVARFENLNDDFKVIEEMCGLRERLPTLNVSSVSKVSVIDELVEEKIRELYFLDFELLGY